AAHTERGMQSHRRHLLGDNKTGQENNGVRIPKLCLDSMNVARKAVEDGLEAISKPPSWGWLPSETEENLLYTRSKRGFETASYQAPCCLANGAPAVLRSPLCPRGGPDAVGRRGRPGRVRYAWVCPRLSSFVRFCPPARGLPRDPERRNLSRERPLQPQG